MRPQRNLIIIGRTGGSHIGASLTRGAQNAGLDVVQLDSANAESGPRWLRRLWWHTLDRRPPKLISFQRKVIAGSTCGTNDGGVIITTGLTPVTFSTLLRLKEQGFICLHFSTDDPWNPTMHATWFLRTLPLYDKVFTPRRSVIPDLEALGCKCVTYLPFGYDPDLYFPERAADALLENVDVLFVGGADKDRAAVIEELTVGGLKVAVQGAYWDRFPRLKVRRLGHAPPPSIRAATCIAPINLCLVRRANRDSHVMRSFEIPAIGGFMLAEDSADHREIFGPEGDCVLYFASLAEAISKAHWALRHPNERRRMAKAGHERVVTGRNTYRDRLEQMLAVADSCLP
jgi:spore maturation protein CgeB